MQHVIWRNFGTPAPVSPAPAWSARPGEPPESREPNLPHLPAHAALFAGLFALLLVLLLVMLYRMKNTVAPADVERADREEDSSASDSPQFV